MPAQPLRRITALAGLTAVLAPAAAQAAPGDTSLVSRQGATPSSHNAYAPAISADGSTVAFVSRATNLSPLDQAGTVDVFAHHRGSSTTGLVSARAPAVPGPDVPGNLDSGAPAVSGSGRYVAFRSDAHTLSDDDQAGVADVFRRDLLTGEIELVSRATGVNGDAGDADSNEPSISADGRLVAFASEAKNLSAVDEDHAKDIFVRDMQTHTTYFVSRDGVYAGNDDSYSPKMSADGSTVAFLSRAPNLASGWDYPNEADVFTHTLAIGKTELVSREPDGGVGQNNDAGPFSTLAISADGRHVAFTTRATNLTAQHRDDPFIVLRDRVADTATLISRATGANGAIANEASLTPSISADGTKVAFSSYATNLEPLDTDSHADIHVRDVAAGTTTLVSRRSLSAGGEKGDLASFDPSISADGATVAFRSLADNFADVAGFGGGQVFVHEMGGSVPAPPAGGGGGGPVPAAPPAAPASAPAPAVAPPVPAASAQRPAAARRARLAFRRGSSSCIRRGRLVLKLKVHQGPRGAKVVRANVKVGKAKTRKLRGKRARRVVLRNLHGKRVKVRITARTSTGALLKRTRTYKTCAKR